MSLSATRRLLALAALAMVSMLPAFPQASTGMVSGTVRDQSGAVIPGASVTLTKTDTSVASRTASNDAGMFAFPAVVPGPYRVEVASPGMQKYEVTLTVQVQQSVSLEPVLQPGQTSTTIVVQDVTPM